MIITFTNSGKEDQIRHEIGRYGGGHTFVVYLAIAINIGLTNHFINLIVRKLLAYTNTLEKHLQGYEQEGPPRLVMTCLNSAALMYPLPSLSNTLKASLISSSLSVSRIFLAIMVKNSGKSIVPFPSASTSLIMSWSSASVGF